MSCLILKRVCWPWTHLAASSVREDEDDDAIGMASTFSDTAPFLLKYSVVKLLLNIVSNRLAVRQIWNRLVDAFV